MAIILGIETSCDETATAVYDSSKKRLLSNCVFSQVDLQALFGGVVPEIASRSHLEKIGPLVGEAIKESGVSIDDIDVVAVTTKPGLIGSLLVGTCFAKGLAWAGGKKLIGVNHLDGHVYSSYLLADGTVNESFEFPHLCLSVSGGHTALYLVKSFSEYELIGQTIDDAAGEAFDKVAVMLGFSYPGGPTIEKLARQVDFKDFCSYPRGKNLKKDLNFTFSGLKTAVLFDLVKRGAFDLKKGVIQENMTEAMQQEVASSLLVCICEIFEHKIRMAFKQYPEARGLSLVGGVAANKFISEKLRGIAERRKKQFTSPPLKFCGDNAAMIAFVGAHKAERGEYDDLTLDVL